MTIRRKLQILALVTLLGLGLIMFTTVSGMNSMQEAESTALRRESYSLVLVEIKASALSTIMLDPTLKETREVFAAAEKNIGDLQTRVQNIIRRPQLRDEFTRTMAQWTQYDQESQRLIKLAGSNAAQANEQLVSLYNTQFKPFQAQLEKFVSDRLSEARAGRAEAERVATRVFWTLVSVISAVALIDIALLLAISHSLQNSLINIQSKTSLLRQGDLTERLPSQSGDELSQIAAGVNDFVAAMQTTLHTVLHSTTEVSSAASQLADSARQVASSSASQSDSAASTASAIEQMSVSVASIADTTGEVRLLSSASREDAQQGNQSISELERELSQVHAGVDTIATHVREFVGSTNAIAGMTQQIRDIADQTNLLALNAAIEAARAGEQGRGFAVVADEVRKLAERSSTTAGEITLVTEGLNAKSVLVDNSVAAGLDSLQASLTCVTHVREVLARSSASVNKTSTGIDDVTASVQEQKSASASIARNVERIAQMAENNRSASQDSAEAATRLDQLATSLRKTIEHFRL
jgi:methyl-accepting chemotaxis protein